MQQVRASQRGMFVAHAKETKFRDVLDGLSNTIAMGEIATDLGDYDIRTHGEWFNMGATGVRNNPSACADIPGLIDPERPRFWNQASGDFERGSSYLQARVSLGRYAAALYPNQHDPAPQPRSMHVGRPHK